MIPLIEVAPPALDIFLADAPEDIRRSYPRADRVQQILHHLEMEPGRSDLEHLVLTDPVLAALNELSEEWQEVWRRRPGAAVRSTLLWHTALQHVPKGGRGYQALVRTAQALTVGNKRLLAYEGQHIKPAAEEPKAEAPRQRAHRPEPDRSQYYAPDIGSDELMLEEPPERD